MATLQSIQALPLLAWFKLVNDTVTGPYLDEVFHVRQAQQYCHGRFYAWDPKITTPPGLYLLSYALSPGLGCSLVSLRGMGILCLALLLIVVGWTYTARQSARAHNLTVQHNALNITLLPPLFFFSALYYTDVPSTLSVLVFHWYFLHSHQSETSTWTRVPVLVLLGMASLAFRQTNIFWVAIFPAGVVLVNELDRGHEVIKESMYRRVEGFGDSMMSVARTSFKMEVIYDPFVRDASIEDYGKTIASLAMCGLKAATQLERLFGLVTALAPYLTLTGLFALFVYWNGGVVLGDKSNHIATLHLPQMLYIWPYFLFFSWPLMLSHLAILPLELLTKIPRIAPLESMLVIKRRPLTPRPWVILVFIGMASTVVHFNTIVHPFTLADNRHYTFYVFRLLMQPSWLKYAVTPVYILGAWACIQAMGTSNSSSTPTMNSSTSYPTSRSSGTSVTRAKPLCLPDGTNSATTTFVLIWLTTTALQLITAPLVEPRYFILPWIFWRMHLPLQQYVPDHNTNAPLLKSRLNSVDYRLWLETGWSAVVNTMTGYIFLKWGFAWPQEPGQIQRFMW